MAGAAKPLDDDRYGPPLEGGRVRRGGPDWRRLSLLVLGLVLSGSLLVGVAAGGTILYGARSIDRVDVPELRTAAEGRPAADAGRTQEAGPAIEEITDVLNVLVVGSDSREGLTDEQLLALGTEEEDGLRTDSIMLLQLDPRRERVSVLSFPRDLLVTRCDGTRGRINAAYGIGESDGTGGARCLVQTVTDFTDIPIDHFVQVDFAGFIDIVDALGGVTLHLEEPIHDPHAGADFPAGCVTMTGTEALSFVRVRRIDSDFGRIARQQRFLREVVAEASSVGTLVNVPRLFSLVDAGARAVETDRDLSLNDMRRIAFSLRTLEPDHLDTRVVPAEHRMIDDVAYVVPDDEAAEELFAAFRDAEAPPEGLGAPDAGRAGGSGPAGGAEERDAEATPEEAPGVEVEDVPPVTVLNGAGVGGLARAAQQQLEEEGFTVVGAANAERFDVARTEVAHAPGRGAEAALLAAALGGAELVVDAEADGLLVLLGADWEPGVVADVQGGRRSPSPTPTPGPAEQVTPTPAETFAGALPGGSC